MIAFWQSLADTHPNVVGHHTSAGAALAFIIPVFVLLPILALIYWRKYGRK